MRILANIFLLAAVFLAGCDSVSERVEERFHAAAPKVQVFSGDEQTIREAVLVAFKRLDFVVNSQSDSDGGIEATGRIRRSEALGDARQLVANLHLETVGPGQVEVRILLTEQVEDSTSGVRSEQAQREHGFYATFFDTLRQTLAELTQPTPPGSGR